MYISTCIIYCILSCMYIFIAAEGCPYYIFLFSFYVVLQTIFSPPCLPPICWFSVLTTYQFFPTSPSYINLQSPEVTRISHSTVCRILFALLIKDVILCYQHYQPPTTGKIFWKYLISSWQRRIAYCNLNFWHRFWKIFSFVFWIFTCGLISHVSISFTSIHPLKR